jgi:phage N-6-adenine-methyltransferase
MAKINNSWYTSNREDWATPQDFFDRMNNEFSFDIDVCANENNAKCDQYYDIEKDGLGANSPWMGNIWCNPPYGTKMEQWLKKGMQEIQNGNANVVVYLIPCRTDTKAWHDYCMKSDEVRLIKGRLKYNDGDSSAPFPSCVVIFRKERKFEGEPHFKSMFR